MGFGMFSVHTSPIAIDFGSASVKLLQVGSGDRPALLAAAELPIPDAIRGDVDRVMSYLEEWLPVTLRDAKFKGRRAVFSVPSAQTFTQHMQIVESDDLSRDELIKAQLQMQMGCLPQGVVVRSTDVCTVHRNGQAQKEVICFAIAKDIVMRYVSLLTKCKLEVDGVHTDTLAMVRAFDHIHRRAADADTTTLYIEMGWGGTRVAITHGTQVAFARQIPIGGKQFDQLIAASGKCDIPSARAHRLSLRGPKPEVAAKVAAREVVGASHSGQQGDEDGGVATAHDRRVGSAPTSVRYVVPPGDPIRSAINVDLTELLDTITDELAMCLRYHQSLFRDRPVNRAIFAGGEARQAWLCQHIVKSLRVPGQLGDPLARMDSTHTPPTPNLKLNQPQPGWVVACGLCTVSSAA